MREIKYRAWGGFYSVGGSPEDRGEWHYWNPIETEFPRPWKKWIGEYTGLKSKSGVEIFEGDIVKIDDFVGQIYWDSSRARWGYRKLIDENKGYRGNEYCAGSIDTWKLSHKEVIGNIYENPELL